MHRAGRQPLSVVAAGTWQTCCIDPEPQAAECPQILTGGQIVATEEAPGAVGPYSQAVVSGSTVYVSGQVGLVPGVSDLPLL